MTVDIEERGVFSGIILIILDLFPKFSAIITAMPEPVLGGAGFVMFGGIGAAGINQLSTITSTQRSLLFLSTAICLNTVLSREKFTETE